MLPGVREQAGPLYGVRVGVCPEGWLRRLAHAFGGAVCGRHAQCPAFAPGSSEVEVVVVVVFWSFYIFCTEFSPTAQSHIVSLHFVAQGDICPSSSTAAQGPGSQVPACLRMSA